MNPPVFPDWLNTSTKDLNKGLHFGHKFIPLTQTAFLHPLQSSTCLGLRKTGSLFNTQQTRKFLLRAFHIIALILRKKGRILIINTNPEFFTLCTNLTALTLTGTHRPGSQKSPGTSRNYSKLKTPLVSYVSYKWVGGLLTNWKQLSKSVLTYAKFSERCEKFLIKNHIEFPKFSRVKKCFQGLLYKQNQTMLLAFNQKPDLLFLVNPNENRGILNEAYRLHIPVIAFTESSTNPKEITYPIPVNNYSIRFLYFCFKKILKLTHLSKRKLPL